MINRRNFIKRSLYCGTGLITCPLFGCTKDKSGEEPGKPPQHPSITPDAGMDLYGSILDDEGKPVAGVVVSDGYDCVLTDEKGIYQMKRDPKALVVFYSTPEQYAIKAAGTVSSAASFFTPLSSDKRYNFNLQKLPAVENDFTLLCIGDPQVTSAADIDRYKSETLPDITNEKRHRLYLFALFHHYRQPRQNRR